MSLFDHGCKLHQTPEEFCHYHNLLHHIVHQNDQILKNQERIMSTQPTVTDLDNAVGTVEAAITKIGNDLKSTIADLEAKITAAPPQTFDPTPEIARLKAAADALSSLDTSVVAADPGAPAASTPASSEPAAGDTTPPASDTGAQTPPADSGATGSAASDTGGTDTPAA